MSFRHILSRDNFVLSPRCTLDWLDIGGFRSCMSAVAILGIFQEPDTKHTFAGRFTRVPRYTEA